MSKVTVTRIKRKAARPGGAEVVGAEEPEEAKDECKSRSV